MRKVQHTSVRSRKRKSIGLSLIPIERIASRIYVIRGERVMFDTDLAVLYEVSTSRLNEQVKRNASRFPSDFAFQLTEGEWESLISQSATSNTGRGGRRKRPWVFTEQGVAMLSGVLHSRRAVEANVAIMRAFVKLRRMLATNEQLARKVALHDRQIAVLFVRVNKLLEPPRVRRTRPIGYVRSSND